MRKSRPGFSLIELTIILALVSLIACLTLPLLTFFNRFALLAQAEKIVSMVTYVQHKAIIEHETHTLTLDTAHARYMDDKFTEILNPPIQFGIKPNTYGPPSKPTTLLTRPSTFANDQILFYPNGTISSGTVYLTDTSKAFMYAISIGVAQMPYVRLYRHAGNTWMPIR